jgi:Zn-dependent alcohol dehydrogenase
MMQAGGMSVILGLVEATQRVSFYPGALLWGRSWTSGLFGGYKARSELPKLVERCMKGVSNLFIHQPFVFICLLITTLIICFCICIIMFG